MKSERWKIVCPDGRQRIQPQPHLTDAMNYAEVFSQEGVCIALSLDKDQLPCPGGKHKVESYEFEHPPITAVHLE